MSGDCGNRRHHAKCVRCKVVFEWHGEPCAKEAACPRCGESLAQVRSARDGGKPRVAETPSRWSR